MGIRLFTALFPLLVAHGALAQDLTREQMVQDIEQLAAAVRSRWAYFEDRTANSGLNLDRLVETSRAAVETVRTRQEFARVLREFVAALQDGHADVQMAGAGLPKKRWPVRVRPCAEGLLVVRVAGLARQDVRVPGRGDAVERVDGRAIEDVIADVERVTFASTKTARRHLAVQWMQLTDEDTVEFECVTPVGERYTTRLPSVVPGGPAWLPEGDQSWSLNWVREDVALIRAPTFATADWERWLKASLLERPGLLQESYRLIDGYFEQVRSKGARAVVLDLRGNEGGTDMLGMRLAKHLLPEPFVYFRLSDMYFRKWSQPGGQTTRPVEQPFGGELVVLIDEGCFSVTDNLLRCLRDLHPRLTVIGRPSGGGTGAPRELAKLKHSGAKITLCSMRVYGPKSGLIEGRGTEPDVKVEWTGEDLLQGRDPDLDAAMRKAAGEKP